MVITRSMSMSIATMIDHENRNKRTARSFSNDRDYTSREGGSEILTAVPVKACNEELKNNHPQNTISVEIQKYLNQSGRSKYYLKPLNNKQGNKIKALVKDTLKDYYKSSSLDIKTEIILNFFKIPSLKFRKTNNKKTNSNDENENKFKYGRFNSLTQILQKIENETKYKKVTNEDINELEQLHPKGDEIKESLNGPLTNITVTTADVRQICKEIKKNSTPGVSGWSYKWFQLLVEDDTICQKLSLIISDIVNNKFKNSKNLQNLLLTSKLVVFQKKNGKLRPICMPEVLLKLASKIVFNKINKLENNLQYGKQAFQSGGMESIIHDINNLLIQSNKYIIYKVDFKNAFNTMVRDYILYEINNNHNLHLLKGLVDFSYTHETNLMNFDLPDDKILNLKSTSGVRQGDTLGAFLYALGLDHILKKIMLKKEYKNLKIFTYLDDLTLASQDITLINNFMEDLQQIIKDTDIKINKDKCEFFQITEENKITNLLGSLIGEFNNQYKNEPHLNKKLKDFKTLLSKIEKIDNYHLYYLLLRYCLNTKITYLLRTVPPNYINEFTKEIDTLVNDSFKKKFKLNQQGPLGEIQEIQINLPNRNGGLGIIKANEIQNICFYSSIHINNDNLKNYSKLEEEIINSSWYNEKSSTTNKTTKQKTKITQKFLTMKYYNNKFQSLKKPLEDEIRLNSIKHSIFFKIIPIQQDFKINLLKDEEFIYCIKSFLGMHPSSNSHLMKSIKCKCGKFYKYDHHFTCQLFKRLESTDRHDAIKNTLYQWCTKTGLPTLKEPNRFLKSFNIQPDVQVDIDNKTYIIDVSIIHTNINECIRRNNANIDICNIREQSKINKYNHFIQETGYTFVPFVMDTYGNMGAQAKLFLHIIADKYVDVFNITNKRTVLLPFHITLSYLLQKYNYKMFLAIEKLMLK